MKNIEKTISFLNAMVLIVFISTFFFTAAIGTMAYLRNWEILATTLTERWFTVMVGELIVMGVIQITKEIVSSRLRTEERRAEEDINNGI